MSCVGNMEAGIASSLARTLADCSTRSAHSTRDMGDCMTLYIVCHRVDIGSLVG